MEFLRIKGAREHNLKNITIDLPVRSFLVVTGLSGSGKSTLAFGTIYAEGYRRYVESLSAYARQFLQNVKKPDVDAIEGLMPAIAVDQKTVSKNPRSTVGTVTEIYDYLRLLFARIGIPISPKTGRPIVKQTAADIVDYIMEDYKDKSVRIVCALAVRRKGEFEDDFKKLQKQGFYDYIIDGVVCGLGDMPLMSKNQYHTIWVVCDDLCVEEGERERVVDAVENAVRFGRDGLVGVLREGEVNPYLFSTRYACPETGFSLIELEPRLFSFNSPSGACVQCDGLGVVRDADMHKLIPQQKMVLQAGACVLSRSEKYDAIIQEIVMALNLPYKPFYLLSQEQRDVFLYGGYIQESSPVLEAVHVMDGLYYKGLLPWVFEQWDKASQRRKYAWSSLIGRVNCSSCQGSRLKKEAVLVRVAGKHIYDLSIMPIVDLKKWMECLVLSQQQKNISSMLIKEIINRLHFLIDIGLGYLSLHREARTLSGGESQRIRLAAHIGSGLTNVLYVLDEPSVGLHPRDTQKLIDSLQRLKTLPNTVIVVEHDLDFIKRADYLVDMGPFAGDAGGYVVVHGTLNDVKKSKESITGAYLRKEKVIAIPPKRVVDKNTKCLHVRGARVNNLKDVNVSIPIGVFVGVTGVSGGGKSSLIKETLYKGTQALLDGGAVPTEWCDGIDGIENIKSMVMINQDPIGRTPRSNPATYCGVWGDIRKIFSETTESRRRGYDVGRFSFNVSGGRCEHCCGAGVVLVSMNFLPDVEVMCEACQGKRFNEDTLQILWKDHSVYDVLSLTVDEALSLFDGFPSIRRVLQCMHDVGLGYVALGQSGTTLSGGEAQRVKLAKELARRHGGGRFYILDEPTTGLHVHDVAILVGVLQKLVSQDNTVLVIEHNMEMVKVVDWMIDLGPEGGEQGGRVVAQGPPEQVKTQTSSVTGRFLP